MDAKNLHPVSRILIILLVGVIVYMAAFAAFSPAVPNEGPGMSRGHMMGNFSTTGNIIVNGTSVAAGLAGMLVLSMLFFRHGHPQGGQVLKAEPAGDEKERLVDEFSILRRALTEDEVLLLEKVREVPDGITQDSLRFRLDWSKAKVSTMLTNLDRMGLVQRERLGKTYKVYYQEKKPVPEK